MRPSQIFSDPGQRQNLIVAFIDVTGAKALGERGWEEADLLRHIGRMFDTAVETIEATGGTVARFQDDAVKVTYPIDKADDAVNAMIRVHESLAASNEGQETPCRCSTGMTSGSVILLPQGDVTGMVVVRARQLALAASANGIFVDTATARQCRAIRSTIGASTNRASEHYIGPEQQLLLEGAPGPVAYHEIHYSHLAFGVKSRVLTQSLRRIATMQ